jgi:murein DD-endopeptidase MepM/ murein hydrolase activator NlpD
MKSFTLFLIAFILVTSSCKTIFKTSAYQTYLNSLKSAGLDQTAMGKEWIEIGKTALNNPNANLVLPFKAEIFFRAEQPLAVAYQISYKQSSKIKITINVKANNASKVFVDLFEDITNPKSVINGYLSDTVIVYQNKENQVLHLRLQPQLLENVYVTIEIAAQAKLAFPVQNGKNSDIKSFWGVEREGGARKHEGIDIFNKKGTPVVAVEDGFITRVQETNLGGKVVWQRLGIGGPSIYYAHLDSQLVDDGQSVKKGDVLGLMGNTGNAITTSPHLHFGIYTSGGAINPLDYVKITDSIPKNILANVNMLGQQHMLQQEDRVLPHHITAISTNGYTLYDHSGQVKYVDNLIKPLLKYKIKKDVNGAFLTDKPAFNAVPIAKFNSKLGFEVLGYQESFLFIKQSNNQGWVKAK